MNVRKFTIGLGPERGPGYTLGLALLAMLDMRDNVECECHIPAAGVDSSSKMSSPCTVKKVIDFPVSRRDITYQTLPGREQRNYSRPWIVR
jgi:hypothetical protein